MKKERGTRMKRVRKREKVIGSRRVCVRERDRDRERDSSRKGESV